MGTFYYYKLEQAEELKRAYTSWIGKKAHIGNGTKETLSAIVIKPKRQLKPAKRTEKLFRVHFEFETKKRFSAHDFLLHNGIIQAGTNPYKSLGQSGEAA